jgi:pyruvate/2-oxoglutarate dehydrogenase complex dihydrolipoamide dehydrogenase (E3) component
MDETQDFMKVLVSRGEGRILGFTMIGAEADEVMTVVQRAMLADLPYPRLRDAVIVHPTDGGGAARSSQRCRPDAVPVGPRYRDNCNDVH